MNIWKPFFCISEIPANWTESSMVNPAFTGQVVQRSVKKAAAVIDLFNYDLKTNEELNEKFVSLGL